MPATLTAQDIKDIRNSYGLSQKSFALVLGIGPASIVRYEQGVVPSKANANLIRAARNPQFMAECLEQDGDLIPEKQRIRAQSIIYDYVSLNPEENDCMHEGIDVSGLPQTMSMDEAYSYTLQQEILNEQAADLIGTLMRHILMLEDAGEAIAEPFDMVLSQLFEVKRKVLSPESDNDTFLEQIRGHLTYQKALIARLCAKEQVA